MTFTQNIARFVAGDISLRAMPHAALQALEQGLDTPSLRILAGLSYGENDFVIERYLSATLQELTIELPTKRTAAIEVGIAIAEEISEGKIEIFDGVKNIRDRAINAYPFFDETDKYCYDSIGFEKVYGLFDTIDDLRDAGSNQWDENKTNQELEQELIADLLNEIRAWIKLMKTSILKDAI